MKNIKEKIAKVFESKIFIGILYGIGIMIILMVVFSLGASFGSHKASFGKAWGENYERNFGRMSPPALGLGSNKDSFPNAHGAIGKIIKIELPTIIVQDKDNTEKVILLKEDTKIQKMKSKLATNDLNVDDFIVVIGSPNEIGQIEAKLIRIMPSPELLNNPIPNDKFFQ